MVSLILLYQSIGAILMSMNQLKQLICLINQAFTPALLVGKLSKLKTIIVPIFSWNLLFQVVYYVYETHAFSPRDIFITWIVTSFSVHWFLVSAE